MGANLATVCVSPLVRLSGVYAGHFSGHQAIDAVGLCLPALSTAPPSLAHLRVERGLGLGRCPRILRQWQLPKFCALFAFSCHLLLSPESGLSSTARPGDVQRESDKRVRFIPKGRSREKKLTPTGLLRPVSHGEGARPGWRSGKARGGCRGGRGPVSRAPRPPPPPP